jgi:hypothetical protein
MGEGQSFSVIGGFDGSPVQTEFRFLSDSGDGTEFRSDGGRAPGTAKRTQSNRSRILLTGVPVSRSAKPRFRNSEGDTSTRWA